MQRPDKASHPAPRRARRRSIPERQAVGRSAVVNLQRPGIRHADLFIGAVRRSRTLHKGLVSPPSNLDAYERYLTSLRKSNQAGFLVVPEGSAEIAGVINVSEIVRGAFQSAYLGYYAFEPLAGKGLMFLGMQKAIRHCFGSLKLHRLEANIQPENLRSIALVRKLGFRREGFSPRYLKVCGKWRDHERWALLSDRGGKSAT